MADDSEIIDFSNLGIRKLDDIITLPLVGKLRNPKWLRWYENLYLVIAVLSLAAVVGFSIYRIVKPLEKDDRVLATVVIVNACACLLYSVDGVLRESPSKLAVLVLSAIVIMSYIIVTFGAFISNSEYTSDKERFAVNVSRLVVVCTCGPIVSGVSIYLAHKYAISRNLVIRTVGGGETLHRYCHVLLIFQSLIAFDFQVLISAFFLSLKNGYGSFGTEQTIIFAGGVPLSIAWASLGYFGMQWENSICYLVFLIVSPAAPAYIIWKLANLNDFYNAAELISDVILICYILALVIRLGLVVWSVFVYRNFGKGLREKMNPPNKNGGDPQGRRRGSYGSV